MGWEERKGWLYYYEKERVGGKVVSRYIGTGTLAEACAVINESERRKHQLKRKALRRERQALEKEATLIRDHVDQIRALTHAVLIAEGYHMHKGQWRKSREYNS